MNAAFDTGAVILQSLSDGMLSFKPVRDLDLNSSL